MSEKKIIHGILLKISISITFFILIIFLLEISFRLAGFPHNVINPVNKITKLDSNGGVSYRPNIVNRLGDYPGDLETDSTGFIHNGSPRNQSDLTGAIFVLGGSTVEGRGSSSNQHTIPAQLESCLNRNSNKTVKVVNAGFSGDYSYQELKRSMHIIGTFKPTMIILLDGRNDAHYSLVDGVRAFDSNSGIWGPFEYANFLILGHKQNFFKLTQSSAFVNFLLSIKTTEKKSTISSTSFFEFPSKEVLNAYTSSHRALRIVGDEMGVSVYTFLQPILIESKKKKSEKEFFFRDSFLKSRNVSFDYFGGIESFYSQALKKDKNLVDLSNLFFDTNETLYVDTVHYNDLGNSLIANSICGYIKGNIN